MPTYMVWPVSASRGKGVLVAALYEFSERPNSLGLDAPTERFCSECGDLVASWSEENIRVYIFIANARRADELEKS